MIIRRRSKGGGRIEAEKAVDGSETSRRTA
jgi:hypothetical protein